LKDALQGLKIDFKKNVNGSNLTDQAIDNEYNGGLSFTGEVHYPNID